MQHVVYLDDAVLEEGDCDELRVRQLSGAAVPGEGEPYVEHLGADGGEGEG